MSNSVDLVKAKKELFAAIREHSENAECLEALALVPELVEQESNPAKYINADSMDCTLAAGRLCRYWKSRKETFKERSLLPMMDLTGEGALSKADVALCDTGIVAQLPHDGDGRPVMLLSYDQSDLDVPTVADALPRVRFYYLNRFSIEHPESSLSLGFVVLRFLEDTELTVQARKETRTLTQADIDLFPLTLHRYHLGYVSAKLQKNFVDRSPYVTQSVKKSTCKSLISKLQLQWSSEHALLLKKMEACGFDKAGLPSSFGGTWQYSPVTGQGHKKLGSSYRSDGASSPQQESTLETGFTRELESQLQALEAENVRLASEIASMCAKTSSHELEVTQPRPAEAKGLEEEAEEGEVSIRREGVEDDSTPWGEQELEVLKGRACVALGVTALLQEERQCSLRILLQDTDFLVAIRSVVEQLDASDVVISSHSKIVSQHLYSTLAFLAVLEDTRKRSLCSLLKDVEIEDMLSHVVRDPASRLAPSQSDQDRGPTSVFIELLTDGVVERLRMLCSDAAVANGPMEPNLLDSVLGSCATDKSRRHVVSTMVESVLGMTLPETYGSTALEN